MVNFLSAPTLSKECKKATKTLRSFRSPTFLTQQEQQQQEQHQQEEPQQQRQQQQQQQQQEGSSTSFHPMEIQDTFVPGEVIEKAAGVAILSSGRNGFLFPGRLCSGLLLARLKTGGWSAPSALCILTFGSALQGSSEGIELLLVLNNQKALEAFSLGARVAIGGNLSVGLGPTSSTKVILAGQEAPVSIYSYAKKKGHFLKGSLEGTIFTESTETNQKLYGQKKVRVRDLVSGSLPCPPEASILHDTLDLKEETGSHQQLFSFPVSSGSPSPAEVPVSVEQASSRSYPPLNPFRFPKEPRGKTRFPRGQGSPRGLAPSIVYLNPSPAASSSQVYLTSPFYSGEIAVPKPVRPLSRGAAGLTLGTARALYDFKPEEIGDLMFQRGDLIEIVEKTEEQNDWWRGRCRGREGYFPANYTQLLEGEE